MKKKRASARRYMQSPRAAKRFRAGGAPKPPKASSKSILQAYD